MNRLDLLAAALGLAALAGINLYLTVFATGIAIHFHWITLSPAYQSLEVLGNPWIITVAGILYFLEFFADKIPWVDSIWDAVHTVIRPIGGAFLAIQVLGHQDVTDAAGETKSKGDDRGGDRTSLEAPSSRPVG